MQQVLEDHRVSQTSFLPYPYLSRLHQSTVLNDSFQAKRERGLMSKPNTTQPFSTKLRNWLMLLARWFIGGLVGYVGSFILFAVSSQGFLPLLSLIFVGQHELFNRIIFAIYSFLFNNFPSSDLKLNASLLIYSTLWGVIGALLLSGRKRQIKIGLLFLIIYIVVGFLSSVIFSFMLFPT